MNRCSKVVLIIVAGWSGLIDRGVAASSLPEVSPAAVNLDSERLAEIEVSVREETDAGRIPGAVVLVGRHGRIAFAGAWGNRAVEPRAEAMTRETIFDMASLTKPIATATSIMKLVERGQVSLADPIAKHLPEFDNHGKGAITVEQLLRHRGGLIPDNALDDYREGPEAAWENLAKLDLVGPPGERFRYTDVGFLILGRLVERVSGKSLAEFAAAEVFEPLGMQDTAFASTLSYDELAAQLDRVAPTSREDGTMLRGVVHDPRSRALGGVAGHAGLFSTADDLARYAQMLLNEGVGANGVRILAPEVVRAMIGAGDTPPGERRGLGWDIRTGYSSPRGSLFGSQSFGHTGFTGTSLWVDPETDTFVVILTSRLHPNGDQPSPTALRRRIATIVASAITDTPPSGHLGTRAVECGIDVLIDANFEPLRVKRVGLVTNHTGRARDGRSTIDVLHQAEEVELVRLFSPEHGIRGVLDTKVGDSRDEATGLEILSLYGDTRKPTPESLEGLDALVFDIQDIGTRFYTYISTLGLVMEAAAEQGLALFVLDRPNPIGGVEVSGPIRDDEFDSFIAHHALPLRHGMTIGELANLFNAERGIGATLTVIPCEGWRRTDLYDQTGLLWVNPSPNMRSLTEALLYPGVGLLEATNLATGRGTDTPFERLGAPWIDPVGFSNALNSLEMPGVSFTPIRFSPTERQYAGEDCGGVAISITDRHRFDPIELGIALAVTLRAQYPDHWEPDGLLRFLADRAAYDAMLEGKGVDAVRAIWQEELRAFRQLRSRFLIYE